MEGDDPDQLPFVLGGRHAETAGLENSIGVIVGTPNKDPNDQKWTDDEAIKGYRAFFDRYLGRLRYHQHQLSDRYQQGLVLEQILKQCGDDLSRDNVIKQAKSLKGHCAADRAAGIRSTPAKATT